MALLIEEYIFSTPALRNGLKLKMSGKRYTAGPSTGKVFIFLHASGMHKEHWEPIIETLLDKGSGIKECWALDWQSHGDSAKSNAEVLTDFVPSTNDWAQGVADFVSQKLQGDRIVVVGHSAGTSAAMLTTKYLPKSIYAGVVLVEPTLLDKALYDANFKERQKQTGMLAKFTSMQPERWDSKELATKFLTRKAPWKDWDPRILSLYVNHGLRLVEPKDPTGPVVTKTSKRHEGASFLDYEATFEAAAIIENVCKDIPIHVIFGQEGTLVPTYIQVDLSNVAKGRQLASITRLSKGGHLVVQENPDGVAEAILKEFNSPNARL
ncbi:alpha/beta-hydrolase [Hymenopellis radicata]|nr:alpha/beta-hydrolase [Hymenopellis radicata]